MLQIRRDTSLRSSGALRNYAVKMKGKKVVAIKGLSPSDQGWKTLCPLYQPLLNERIRLTQGLLHADSLTSKYCFVHAKHFILTDVHKFASNPLDCFISLIGTTLYT